MPAPLARVRIDSVRSDEAMFVLEDESGQLEGDSAAASLISPILCLVPFIPHCIYTLY
jgi:hypothetical protein